MISLILTVSLAAFTPSYGALNQPLLWETPVSWEAPAQAPPKITFSPEVTKKLKAVKEIEKKSGPAAAALALKNAKEPELILTRAGLKREAGQLKGATADYRLVLESKNMTAPKALAIAGYKNILRLRITNGEKEPYQALIESLKSEWLNEEALDLIPEILRDPEVPLAVKDFVRKEEPIMALRLGRYDRAAELWAPRKDKSSRQWLAQTENRRGNFVQASRLRLELAQKATTERSRNIELAASWGFLVRGGLYDEAQKLAKKYTSLQKRKDYQWFMGLSALYQNKLKEAQKHFNEVLKQKKARDHHLGARYFLARTYALEGLAAEAQSHYQILASQKKASYYKILAQGQLYGSSPNDTAWQMARLLETGPSGRDIDSPGLAKWLGLKGLKPDSNDPAAQAARKGLYREAVRSLGKIKYDPPNGPTALPGWSHPLVYSRPLLKAYRDHQLSPSLVLALMRTESAFQADIMSVSNARGLMQLLPATANKLAAALGEKAPGALDLFDPSLNIRYGTTYFAALRKGFGGNTALALAGYNGGPYNMRQMILAKPQMPLDVFIECLPFQETSNYVKRITLSRYIYETVYLGEAGLPSYTSPIEPPLPSLPSF